MTEITVRRMAFEWPDDLPILPNPDDISQSCELVALSFTLPYLEPYLIRTMRVAGKEDISPELAQDLKAFSKQEAQHHQNHSRINNIVRAKLPPETALAVRALEDKLEADYQRYTETKSLKFNLAYAEGFEAMTLALALSLLATPPQGSDESWANLLAWHLAEEVEHRTVTFDAYDKIYGGYLYRLFAATRSQLHYLWYIVNLAVVLETNERGKAIGRSRVILDMLKRHRRLGTLGRYARTLSPRYNPAKIDMPKEVVDLLAMYDQLAA